MLQSIKENDANKFVHELKLTYTSEMSECSCNSTASQKTTLERMKTLLQASLAVVNNQISGLTKLDVVSVANSTGRIILEVDNIQCFEPRGRFNLKITSTNLFLEGKQFSVLIPIEYIAQIICLPSFTSAKKEGEDYLAFHLKDSIKINNKESKQLLLNLMKIPNSSLKMNNTSDVLTESTAIILAIQEATNLSINRPQTSLFSTKRENKSYLKCYRGTQEGAIYPLQCGIVFVKPLLYIPTEEIASLSAGRGGGAGNTRYVDLIIETTGEKNHEFTNIDRDELPAVQQYVKGYLEARALKQQQQHNNKNNNKQIKKEDDDDIMILDDSHDPDDKVKSDNVTDLYVTDSSDESDEDYDPNASDSDDSGYKHKHMNDSDNNSDDSSDDDRESEEYESDASDCSGDNEIILKKPSSAKKLTEERERKADVAMIESTDENMEHKVEEPTISTATSSTKSSSKPTTSTVSTTTSAIKAVPGQPMKRQHLPSASSAATTIAVLPNLVKTEDGNSNCIDVDIKPECNGAFTTTCAVPTAITPAAILKEGRKKSVPVKKESSTTASVVTAAAVSSTSNGPIESGSMKVTTETSTTAVLPEGTEQMITTVTPSILPSENTNGPSNTITTTNNNITTSCTTTNNSVTMTSAANNTVTTTSVANTVTGVKRTIKDMFAAQNKKILTQKEIIVADLTTDK